MPTVLPKAATQFREASARAVMSWTPTQVRAAYAAAEAGHLLRLADLVDATLEDDRVAGTLKTRTRGLLRLPLDFEVEPEHDAMLEALKQDFWSMLPEAQLGELMSWGISLGVGLAQMIWDRNARGRLAPKAQVWHPRWLRYDFPTDRWRLTTANAGEITVDPADPQWFLFLPYGPNRPWRSATIRPTAMWWLLKRYAATDWGTYGEAHGNPTRVATAPSSANKALRAEVAADLQDIAGRTGMVMPDGFDIKLLEATARTWETFKAQVDTADAGIAVTILGQTLTTEVKGASLAAAKVHDLVRHDVIAADENVLETALHYGPLQHWASFNFGVDEPRAPWASWDTTPPTDARAQAETRQARAAALEALAGAIKAWRQLGIPLDLEKLAAEHDLPIEDLQAAAQTLTTGDSKSSAETDEAFAERIARTNQLAEELRAKGIDVSWPHIITGDAVATAPGAYLQAARPATGEPPQPLTRLSGRPIMLASGDNPRDAAGLIRGELYIESLARRLDGIQPFKQAVATLAEAVQKANSYQELLDLIPALYEQIDIDNAQPFMEAVMLADLAGRLAAEEDA